MIKVQKRLVVYCLSVSMFCILDITNVQGVTNEEIVTQIQWLQEQVQVLSGQLSKANAEIENLKAKRSEHSLEPGAEKLVVKDEKGREVILPAYMTPPEEKEDTGFFLEAGFRYINPRGVVDVDIGTVDLDQDGSPVGRARSIKLDTFPTGFYKVGYKFKDNGTVSASFWRLNTSEDTHLQAPPGGMVWPMFPPAGQLTRFVTIGGNGVNIAARSLGDTGSIDGHLKFRLGQYDLDYTRSILSTQRFDLRGLVGGRYADLDNTLTVKQIDTAGKQRGTLKSTTRTRMGGVRLE